VSASLKENVGLTNSVIFWLLFFNVQGLQEFAPTQDEAVYGVSNFILEHQVHQTGTSDLFFSEQASSGPKPHPPMSPPPKHLVQDSEMFNEYAKRRRHYSKVRTATPSDYTKQIKDYLKAVKANRGATLNKDAYM
jgi:hypothetical protein